MEWGLVPTGEQWEDFQLPQHNQILVPSITLVAVWKKKIQGLLGSPKTPTELQSFLGSLRIAKGSLQLYPWEFQCQIIPLAAPYPPCSHSIPMLLQALSEFFSAVTTFANTFQYLPLLSQPTHTMDTGPSPQPCLPAENSPKQLECELCHSSF